ncbi:MAG: T9SS type A sorting domain-containing protein [Fluviicola sp.]
MKHLLLSIALVLAASVSAQPWNFIGSTTGIANATEVDIEISAAGDLFMAYIDTDNGNRISCRKWNKTTQAWQLVGTAGISSPSAFGVQLVMRGENPVVGCKVLTTISATTYEFLEVYSFNGTVWQSQGVGTYFWTFHAKDYSLSVNAGNELFVTYYNREYQTYPEGLITIKLGSSPVFIGGSRQDDNNGYLSAGSSWSTTGNNVITAFEEDMDMDYGITLSSTTTSTHNNSTYIYGTDATKIVFEKGLSSTNYSMMYLSDQYSAKTLYYKAWNGSTFGTTLTVATSTSLTDFDFAAQGTNTFVFYRLGTTCFFRQISGDMTPSGTITTITSGTSLAPSTATSLAAETYYGVHVIAYVSGGKCYVKEYNLPANIEDFDLFQFCEGTSFNNNGDVALYNLDPNFSQANISMTCQSQNTGLIPQSAINISGNGLSYYLTITGTNDVIATTTADLLWTLLENGSPIGTVFTPVTIFPNPTITFNLPGTSVCENQSPVSLIGKASPAGGTWSGAGIQGNFFVPSAFNPAPSTTSYVTYSKTSAQGCSSKDSVLITINQTPDLTVSATEADCDQANGTASVNINGGAPAYDIYWSNGATTSSTSNLAPGQYFVNVTDNNGCIAMGVASVGSNGIVLTGTVDNVSCNDGTDGGVNITVTGANGPFTFAWSTGATTEDLSNIPSGPYEVNITDATGCVSMASFNVLEPAALALNNTTTINPSCGQNNGNISVQMTGGAQPFTYGWQNDQGTTIGTNSASLSNVGAGYYTLTVTDNSGCQYSTPISLSNTNGPVIAIDTIISSDCTGNGGVQLVDVSNNVQSYQWSNGQTTQNLSNVVAGTYIVEATGLNGCVTVLSADVEASLPDAATICLVTVDTATNTNLVVWEKPITNSIDHFNIYRETSQAGLYQLIGQVPYADESIYNDLVASPSVRSWRYKISSVDACGNESEISEHHKTIHLVINQGLGTDYNLSWDSYEGFTYSSFEIFRYTDVDGWNQITTMPTSLFTYTDTPPTENGLTYIVVVDAPQICTTAKAQDFNTTRSNKDRGALAAPQGISEDALQNSVIIYPSPANEQVSIQNENTVAVAYSILDMEGRVVAVGTLKPGISVLETSALSSGLYQVNLVIEETRTTKKLLIQH